MTLPELVHGKRRDRLTALGLGIVAFLFRIWNLKYPKGFVFDEVYYAQDANSLLHHGVELDSKTGAAEFIVHPSIGKWMIAVGIKIFGYHEFGWRISAALIGTASIVMIFYIAKRLFNNYFLSLSAGILMSADGLHLVMSRTALLDIFLMFFTLLAFLFLLRGQHYLAGISLGLATATKWSGLYYLVAYLGFTLYVDYRNNRALELEHPIDGVIRQKLFNESHNISLFPLLFMLRAGLGGSSIHLDTTVTGQTHIEVVFFSSFQDQSARYGTITLKYGTFIPISPRLIPMLPILGVG